MQCEVCQASEATVHLKQVFEGGVKTIHVCQACAEKGGFNVQSPISMMDFLFGLDMQGKNQAPAQDKVCPACRMKFSDFRRLSRLGCGECYKAFAEDLSPLLDSIQEGPRHRGKVPARERVSVEIGNLDKALKAAVAAQNFEEAARLRDQIRALAGRARAPQTRRRNSPQDHTPSVTTEKQP